MAVAGTVAVAVPVTVPVATVAAKRASPSPQPPVGLSIEAMFAAWVDAHVGPDKAFPGLFSATLVNTPTLLAIQLTVPGVTRLTRHALHVSHGVPTELTFYRDSLGVDTITWARETHNGLCHAEYSRGGSLAVARYCLPSRANRLVCVRYDNSGRVTDFRHSLPMNHGHVQVAEVTLSDRDDSPTWLKIRSGLLVPPLLMHIPTKEFMPPGVPWDASPLRLGGGVAVTPGRRCIEP